MLPFFICSPSLWLDRIVDYGRAGSALQVQDSCCPYMQCAGCSPSVLLVILAGSRISSPEAGPEAVRELCLGVLRSSGFCSESDISVVPSTAWYQLDSRYGSPVCRCYRRSLEHIVWRPVKVICHSERKTRRVFITSDYSRLTEKKMNVSTRTFIGLTRCHW